MQRYIFMALLFFYASFSWSVTPVKVVYRADDRNMTEIVQSGGMWPWREGIPDNDLIHHFEGESIEGRTSNFVSTTSSIRVAVEHAASLARPNSEVPFDPEFSTYIYVIRPDLNFFDVDASLISARNTTTDATQRARLNSIIHDYTGMEEWVARQGFSHQRIISRAQLTGGMLQRFGVNSGSPLFSDSFWTPRWEVNANYNPAYDTDISNNEVYSEVGMPSGYIDEVENGNQIPVRLGFTCLGVNPEFKESRIKLSTKTCSANQYLSVNRKFYDKTYQRKILLLIDSAE